MPKLCLAIDVKSGLIVDADRSHVIWLQRAKLACEEIATLWPGSVSD